MGHSSNEGALIWTNTLTVGWSGDPLLCYQRDTEVDTKGVGWGEVPLS